MQMMNGAVFNRLEIDVMQLNELLEAVEIAHKYKLPAIIAHPNLSSDAIIAKSRVGGKFKIITPIDWPKGETFGMAKMRGLSTDSLETDGYEFLLTANKSEIDTRNEAKALTEFIKKHLTDQAEVRFVLGASSRSDENLRALCQGLLTIRTPSMIRVDIHTKTQVNKANPEEHNRHMTLIRELIKAPLKISGNINNLKAVVSCPSAARYAVNVSQAKTIIKEFKSQPDQLRELLGTE